MKNDDFSETTSIFFGGYLHWDPVRIWIGIRVHSVHIPLVKVSPAEIKKNSFYSQFSIYIIMYWRIV